MSVALDTAIYSTLTGDTSAGGVNNATTGATGGFHQMSAPQGSGYPRVHFQELLTTASYTFQTLSSDHVYYQFTVYAVDTPTGDGVSTAGTLAERIRTLLTDPSMAVSGKTLLYSRFDRTIPPNAEWEETSGGRYVYSKGLILELWLA